MFHPISSDCRYGIWPETNSINTYTGEYISPQNDKEKHPQNEILFLTLIQQNAAGTTQKIYNSLSTEFVYLRMLLCSAIIYSADI